MSIQNVVKLESFVVALPRYVAPEQSNDSAILSQYERQALRIYQTLDVEAWRKGVVTALSSLCLFIVGLRDGRIVSSDVVVGKHLHYCSRYTPLLTPHYPP
jgi:hypothetical protein